MRNVDDAADEIGDTKFGALPERAQLALGELASAAREGLLALSVGVGPGGLTELMADRAAVRHGHEAGQATLGGRRVPVERQRCSKRLNRRVTIPRGTAATPPTPG